MLAGACAWAGPLDRAIVHPEARWLVHVDVESALQSGVGRHMLERMEKEPRQPLNRMSKNFGLDIRADLRGVTVFALPGQIDDGIAILTTSAAADGIGESLAKAEQQELSTAARGGFTVHSWKMRTRTFHAAVHAGLREGERFVILADSERVLDIGIGAVSRAVNAVECKGHTKLPEGQPKRGSFLFAAAGELNAPGEPRPRAEILREARSLVLDVGREEGGEGETIYGDATIEAADEARAAKVRQMAQGVLAFIAMSAADDPDDQPAVGELVSGVKITAEGGRCVMTSRHGAGTVIAIYDMMEEKRREAREAHGAENHKHGPRGEGSKPGPEGPPAPSGAPK